MYHAFLKTQYVLSYIPNAFAFLCIVYFMDPLINPCHTLDISFARLKDGKYKGYDQELIQSNTHLIHSIQNEQKHQGRC